MGTYDNRLYFGSVQVIRFEKQGILTRIQSFYFSVKKGLRLYVSVFDSHLKEVGFRSFSKNDHYTHLRGFVAKYVRNEGYRAQFKVLPESVLKEKACHKAFSIRDLQAWSGDKESILCADMVAHHLPSDMKTCMEKLSAHECPCSPESRFTPKPMNTFNDQICKSCEDVCYGKGRIYCGHKRTRLIPIEHAVRQCPRKKHARIKPHNQLQLFA